MTAVSSGTVVLLRMLFQDVQMLSTVLFPLVEVLLRLELVEGKLGKDSFG